jgi:hypothetical protein
VVLARLIAPSDFAVESLNKTDRRRLRSISSAINADRELLLAMPGAVTAIYRLKVAAALGASR